MKKTILTTGLYGFTIAGGSAAIAQEKSFAWEGSLEIGVDSTVDAGDPTAELTDIPVTRRGV